MLYEGKNIARVFPHKTNATPTDADAYIGKPKRAVFAQYDEFHVSVTYTYDIPNAEAIAEKLLKDGCTVKVGGPAYGDRFGDFVPGLYIAPGWTFTSRGCPNHCWFCSVYAACHGQIKELPITDGWHICDDNILATSPEHFKAVIEMLRRQPQKAIFSGGIEAKILKPWQAELLHSIRPARMYCAYDTPDDYEPLVNAGRTFQDAGFTITSHVLCCYVLIGYKGDTFERAEMRLRQTIDAGFMPYSMLYRDYKGQVVDEEWRKFQRTWTSPQIVGAKMREYLTGQKAVGG